MPNPKLPSDTVIVRTIGNCELTLTISPCVYMHKNYPLQVCVSMSNNGGQIYLSDPNATGDNATLDHINALFDKVRLVQCSRCGQPAFDPTTHKTNRAGLCESCFMTDLRASFNSQMAELDARMAEEIARKKKQGFKYLVTAWIHPEEGDDAQVLFWYKKEPTSGEITHRIKQLRSQIHDDFNIKEI